jgi:hypothetical protein
VALGRVKKPDEFFAAGHYEPDSSGLAVEMQLFQSASGQSFSQLAGERPYQYGIVSDRHPASVNPPCGVSAEFRPTWQYLYSATLRT